MEELGVGSPSPPPVAQRSSDDAPTQGPARPEPEAPESPPAETPLPPAPEPPTEPPVELPAIEEAPEAPAAAEETAEPQAPPPETEPIPPAAEPFRFFSTSSFWNEPLEPTAPLDPSSEQLSEALVAEVDKELLEVKGPAISTTSYSVPVYTVPADQPSVPVQLMSRFSVPALSSAWSQVPLPASARPAAGSDGHLVVWQPSTDHLWEFWRMRNLEGTWQASWGGAIEHVSTNSGAYDSTAWSGASGTWGASAAGLSIAGGLITLEQLEAGEIDHALALGLPAVQGGVYSSPATRTDGRSTDPLSLPEGARLRLDPNLDLSQMRLPRLTRMLAEAAQRYGIVVRDVAGTVTFYGEDPTPTGTSPYLGPTGYFEGNYAGRVLTAFPWDHLQVLKMDLRGR